MLWSVAVSLPVAPFDPRPVAPPKRPERAAPPSESTRSDDQARFADDVAAEAAEADRIDEKARNDKSADEKAQQARTAIQPPLIQAQPLPSVVTPIAVEATSPVSTPPVSVVTDTAEVAAPVSPPVADPAQLELTQAKDQTAPAAPTVTSTESDPLAHQAVPPPTSPDQVALPVVDEATQQPAAVAMAEGAPQLSADAQAAPQQEGAQTQATAQTQAAAQTMVPPLAAPVQAGPGSNRQNDKINTPRERTADAAAPTSSAATAARPDGAAQRADATPAAPQSAEAAAPQPPAGGNDFGAQLASQGDGDAVPATRDTPTSAAQAEQRAGAQAPQAALRSDPGQALRAETLAQLAVKIAKRFDGQNTTFHLRLDPPEMGQVAVKLVMGADKRVSARISAEKPEAISALSARADELGTALRDLGLDVQTGDLSFDMTPQGQNTFAALADEPAPFRLTRVTTATDDLSLTPADDGTLTVQGFTISRTPRRELRA